MSTLHWKAAFQYSVINSRNNHIYKIIVVRPSVAIFIIAMSVVSFLTPDSMHTGLTLARVKVQSTSTMSSALVSSWSCLSVRTMALVHITAGTAKMLVLLAQVRNYYVGVE